MLTAEILVRPAKTASPLLGLPDPDICHRNTETQKTLWGNSLAKKHGDAENVIGKFA